MDRLRSNLLISGSGFVGMAICMNFSSTFDSSIVPYAGLFLTIVGAIGFVGLMSNIMPARRSSTAKPAVSREVRNERVTDLTQLTAKERKELGLRDGPSFEA
jgi:hypothetical protein